MLRAWTDLARLGGLMSAWIGQSGRWFRWPHCGGQKRPKGLHNPGSTYVKPQIYSIVWEQKLEKRRSFLENVAGIAFAVPYGTAMVMPLFNVV